ncbi:MAG: protease HtpX [Candidatus Aenigmatarchaeota archaeon]|nr:MAG: protease HtpX [Candidatus Aenigmarchaeota archaeon]
MLNTLRVFALLALLTGILLGLGYLLGGFYGATLALLLSFGMNFFAYWYSDTIVLNMYRAKELKDSKIKRMVRELSKEAGIPEPKLYVINTDVPNAFATGRDPKHSAVAVTRGLLQHLSPNEIRGVLAHELSHIKNRDTLVSTVAATIAGAVTWLAHMLGWALLSGRDRDAGGAIFMMIFAPLAAGLIRMAISRSREFQADETGAKISGKPLDLASALRKIEAIARQRPLQINEATSHLFIINPLGSLQGLFSTHPPTEERIRRLERLAKGK